MMVQRNLYIEDGAKIGRTVPYQRDQEWSECVQRFLICAETLQKCHYFKSPKAYNRILKFEKPHGFFIDKHELDDPIVSELFMRYRIFYLQKEPTNFNKVANEFLRRVEDDYIRVFVKNHIKALHDNPSLEKTMDIQTPFGSMVSRKNIELVFNGECFHTDVDKERVVRELGGPDYDIIKTTVFWMIVEKAKAVLYFANILYQSDVYGQVFLSDRIFEVHNLQS